eukprot:3874267-Amphidinium_carterae.1
MGMQVTSRRHLGPQVIKPFVNQRRCKRNRGWKGKAKQTAAPPRPKRLQPATQLAAQMKRARSGLTGKTKASAMPRAKAGSVHTILAPVCASHTSM